MVKIDGYKKIATLQTCRRFNVYRAVQVNTRQTVLIKVAGTPEHNYLVKEEYDIVSALDIPHIFRPLASGSEKGLYFIVMEDFNGRPQADMETGAMTPEVCLSICLGVTKALCSLHDAGVIHTNLNPANIWIDRETGRVKLCGMRYAGAGPGNGEQAQEAVHVPPDDLNYISPEQTGRTKSVVTRTSDFYSLGCTFYRLLTGQPPHVQDDPLELIHAHMAVTPQMPHLLNPDIPGSVSRIIMKLIRKNSPQRYQNCADICHDFERCLNTGVDGILGRARTSKGDEVRAAVPAKKRLYGRDKEINTLERILTNGDQTYPLVLVSGNPGIGKTALIEEVGRRWRHRSRFVIGKHDNMSKRSGVRDAFESLTLQIMAEGERRILKWRTDISRILGRNAVLIAHMVPMLKPVIDDNPSTIDLPVMEIDSRLPFIFRQLIKTVASPENPLVFFLDDLQWADAGTLHFLHTVERRPIKNFLLICAFRNRETDMPPPFTRFLETVRRNNQPLLDIRLQPLNRATQNRWMSDILGKPVARTRKASRILYEKTDGIPFFIEFFLQEFWDTTRLSRKGEYEWSHCLAKAGASFSRAMFSGFLQNKIEQLEEDSVEMLKYSSCLGSVHSVRFLESVLRKSKREFEETLDPILRKGLLVMSGGTLKFIHDIVQETVYGMMPALERQQKHLQAGRSLRDKLPEEGEIIPVFIVADQLNMAGDQLSNADERLRLAQMNLTAGQKEKERSFLDAAAGYFESGIGQLPENAWSRHYSLALSLYSGRCEILYVINRCEEADALFVSILENAERPDHLLKIFEAKSSYLMQSYKAQEVIDAGLSILKRLNYQVPHRFSRPALAKEILWFKWRTAGLKTRDIASLPEIIDPGKKVIIRVLIIISRACALNGHPYAFLSLFRTMCFILSNGITPYAAYVFSFYGTVLSHLQHDVKKGYEFAELAKIIVERFGAQKYDILTSHLFINVSINRYGQTREHLNRLKFLLKKSLETGLFMNIFNIHAMFFFLRFISGNPLEEVEREMLAARQDIVNSNQMVWMDNLELLFQVIRFLRGKKSKQFLFEQPLDMNDPETVRKWRRTNTVSTLADYYLYRQIISYFSNNPEEGLRYAQQGKPYFKSYVSLPSQMTHVFFYSLSLADCYEKPGMTGKRNIFFSMLKNKMFLKKIHSRAPENNPHMFFLVKAEIARVKGRFEKAASMYDRAAASAEKAGYLHVEAICCERAAKLYRVQGNHYLASAMISKSAGLFRRWGSRAAADLLEQASETDPSFLPGGRPGPAPFAGNDSMDIYSVLKASQAISKEIRIDKLLERLMELILENSGAQRAFLILDTDNKLKIEASGDVTTNSIRVLQDVPVETAGNAVPNTIIYHTYFSGEAVILDHAVSDYKYNADPYIETKQPVSVLCTPVPGKKEARGVLYLENNLISGAFTTQRLKILNLLISQVVISIENSRLYEKLKEEIKQKVIAAQKLEVHKVQLQKMSAQLAETEERERKTIARDLHDSVTQTLALSVAMLKDPEGQKSCLKGDSLGRITSFLEQALDDIRSLTFQLFPPLLYDLGLEPALEWLCEDMFEKHGLPIRFSGTGKSPERLEELCEIAVYRAVRELIINIVKHADASAANLELRRTDGRLHVHLTDNGIGFGSLTPGMNNRFGIFSVSERMHAMNGNMTIDSKPGKGTKIKIDLPFPGDS